METLTKTFNFLYEMSNSYDPYVIALSRSAQATMTGTDVATHEDKFQDSVSSSQYGLRVFNCGMGIKLPMSTYSTGWLGNTYNTE